MSTDELINDVARRMTTLETRPVLRARVVAAIDAEPRERGRTWVLPTAATVAIASVALVWFLMPPAPVIEHAPVVATERPAATMPAPPNASTGAGEQPVARPVASVARAGRPAGDRAPVDEALTFVPGTATYVWTDAALPEIPMLPPLAGPPAIVIEPIAWDEVVIAPLTVELIEVRTLVVEPLASPEGDGV